MMFRVILILVMFFMSGQNVQALEPLASDNRIRTFVYNGNEVFRLTTKFGYQSNIELAKDESILTLSVGDPTSFKITPSGNRLFVSAVRNDSLTNMTLITDKRAYQFELSSVVEDDNNHDIIYVMRFFYPDASLGKLWDQQKGVAGKISHSGRSMNRGSAAAQVAQRDLMIKEVSADNLVNKVRRAASNNAKGNKRLNSSYSIAGEQEFSPLEVFDDGRSTFFKFSPNISYSPALYIVSSDGMEASISARKEGGYVVVSGVYPKFALRLGASVICIFNENISSSKVAAR